LKRTRITLNRFITFTQNWLGKTRLCCFLSLILFSCTEDPSTIGFKGADSRFKVYYKEIEIPSSVILTDSLPTFNNITTPDAPRRLLVGRYTDEKFGTIDTEAYTQFRPYPGLTIPADAELDSAVLTLTFDYYTYGTPGLSLQKFYVHELLDSILSEQPYYANSSVAYDPSPIGEGNYEVDPSVFDAHLAKNHDTDDTNNIVDTLSITLDQNFAQRLYQLAQAQTTDYTDFRKFRKIFKGFAIRSEGAEKVVGFDPYYDPKSNFRSRVLLYYNYPDVNNVGKVIKRKAEFSLFTISSLIGVQSFSSIKASRAGSPIQDINELHKEFFPPGDERYIQAGSQIFTTLDFSNFIKFSDTLSNMIINSAELTIDPVESQAYPMPEYLGLRVLTDKNRFRKSITAIPSFYNGLVAADNNGVLALGERINGSSLSKKFNLVLSENADGTYKYSDYFTTFFQRMFLFKDEENLLLKYGLISSFPEMGKSVNRLVFKKDKIKLKLFYTLPSTEKKD
jgi:hypothetical protein